MNEKKEPLVKLYHLIQLVLIVIVIYFIWPHISNVVLILAIVFLFTTILLPAVDWLEGKIKSRILAVLMLLFFLLAIIVLFFGSFGVNFYNEGKEFSQNIDKEKVAQTLEKMSQSTTAKLPGFIKETIHEQTKDIDYTARVGKILQSIAEKFTAFAAKLGTFVFLLFMTLIFTIILLYEYHNFKKSLVSLISNRYFEISLRLISQIEKQVSGYLTGQLLAATSVAILSILGLFLINAIFDANLSLIIFIGVIAGLANLIPLIGPFAGMIPAILIAILNNIQNPAAVEHWLFIPHIIIMFIIVQQIDNNLVSPVVVGKSVGIHPIVVLIALIIGGNLMGPIGMLFAVPAVGVMKVVFTEIRWVMKNAQYL